MSGTGIESRSKLQQPSTTRGIENTKENPSIIDERSQKMGMSAAVAEFIRNNSQRKTEPSITQTLKKFSGSLNNCIIDISRNFEDLGLKRRNTILI